MKVFRDFVGVVLAILYFLFPGTLIVHIVCTILSGNPNWLLASNVVVGWVLGGIASLLNLILGMQLAVESSKRGIMGPTFAVLTNEPTGGFLRVARITIEVFVLNAIVTDQDWARENKSTLIAKLLVVSFFTGAWGYVFLFMAATLT